MKDDDDSAIRFSGEHSKSSDLNGYRSQQDFGLFLRRLPNRSDIYSILQTRSGANTERHCTVTLVRLFRQALERTGSSVEEH